MSSNMSRCKAPIGRYKSCTNCSYCSWPKGLSRARYANQFDSKPCRVITTSSAAVFALLNKTQIKDSLLPSDTNRRHLSYHIERSFSLVFLERKPLCNQDRSVSPVTVSSFLRQVLFSVFWCRLQINRVSCSMFTSNHIVEHNSIWNRPFF